jgi:hypothetical protein
MSSPFYQAKNGFPPENQTQHRPARQDKRIENHPDLLGRGAGNFEWLGH